MYVLVTPDGAKIWHWHLKYCFAEKEKLLALGVYPQVRPAEARAARDEARRQLLTGRDPASARRDHKRAALISAPRGDFQRPDRPRISWAYRGINAACPLVTDALDCLGLRACTQRHV